MVVIARRKRGQPTWHYCQNCSGWPESDYETGEAPAGGGACWECHSLDRAGGCVYKAGERGEGSASASAANPE